MEAHKFEQLAQIFSRSEIRLLEKLGDCCTENSRWVRSDIDDEGHGRTSMSLTINKGEWSDLISLNSQLCLPF